MHRPVGRPQVVAHRGSSHTTAEHTLGAYVKALDEGAEGLECDVRLTADGHLVCVHDRRVNRTSNGVGPLVDRAQVGLERVLRLVPAGSSMGHDLRDPRRCGHDG